ncbi:MAG: hypothetical protein KY448_18375 [Cyanobacteria bacterium 0813]|nr:hypothetical protein [Cyanobacteria bacterium 0813]
MLELPAKKGVAGLPIEPRVSAKLSLTIPWESPIHSTIFLSSSLSLGFKFSTAICSLTVYSKASLSAGSIAV